MNIDKSNIFMILAGAFLGFAGVTWFMGERPQPNQPAAQPVTSGPAQSSYGTDMVLLADRAGHYWLDAEVEQASLRFMMDTGATTTVLSHDDAEDIGIDTDRLTYDVRVHTGAGEVMFARTKLPYVQASAIRVDGLDALVAPKDTMAKSVLGMNFMRRLSSYSVESNKMTLAP